MDQPTSLPPLDPLPAARLGLGKPRIYTSDEWEKQRDTITELYLNEGLTLAKVRTIMAEEHDFCATGAQYKNKINGWGLGKNLDNRTALAILQIEERRKCENGKSTNFNYHGKPISSDRMAHLRKKHRLIGKKPGPENQGTPPNVDYSTPSTGGDSLGYVTEADCRESNDVVMIDDLPHSEFTSTINSPSIGAISLPEDIIHTTDLESKPQNQKIDNISLDLDVQDQNSAKNLISEGQSQYLSNIHTHQTQKPPSHDQPIKVYITGDPGTLFGFTGASWVNSGAPSTIGSWIRDLDRVSVSEISLPNLRALSPYPVWHLLETPAPFSSCCGISFHTVYSMLSHYEQNHGYNGEDKGLLEAARNGNDTVVRLLLENAVETSVQDNYGCTALHLAARRGHEKVVRLLLENAVETSVQDKDGCTALHLAARRGHEKVVRLLLENAVETSVQDNYGCTALHLAARRGHEKVVRLLLEKAVETSVQDKDGRTALHLAARCGHEKVVRLLLEKGVDTSVQDNDGCTALHLAADCGHEEVVRLLLEKGVETSVQDKGGYTALHCAAAKGHKEILCLLLEKGLDHSAQSKNGCTALHLAAAKGHKEVVHLLLQKDTKISVWNHNG